MTLHKKAINTSQAPEAIGTYSQAMRVDNVVYISGQIPLSPETQQMVEGSFKKQLYQVFDNVQAICAAAGGSLSDVVKVTIYLTDLAEFPLVNAVMAEYFNQPYPARAVLGVASLPKNAAVEMDAIMVMNSAT